MESLARSKTCKSNHGTCTSTCVCGCEYEYVREYEYVCERERERECENLSLLQPLQPPQLLHPTILNRHS